MSSTIRPVPDIVTTLDRVFSLVRDRRRWEMHGSAGLGGRALGAWRTREIDGVTVHITEASEKTDAMLWWRGPGWHLLIVPAYSHVLPAADERPFHCFSQIFESQVDRAKQEAIREVLNQLDHAAASALISAAVLRERLGEHQL